ncbi:MAG: hypothetical protein K0R31_863 [Clostridiales bacterium]|jgi:threonine dehydrogenase-like Zn-dependent dehydrogenase|nr:hypothetical protein [Clostridiales bacterium]
MVLTEPEKFEKQEFDIPKVEEDGLLIKVEMVSICGSDRLLFKGMHKASSFPMILGHEVVGYVHEIGAKAKNMYNLDIGDRVTVEPYLICKSCEYCLKGYYQAHYPRANYGVSLKCDKPPYLLGGYGEYMYIKPGSKLHKINRDVPAQAASLSSVIGNGIRWVRTRGKAKMAESIVIVGSGAQGLASVVAASEAGADPIIVLGLPSDEVKFEVAHEFGAHYTIDITKCDPVEEVKKITKGRMADLVIECAGAGATVKLALSLARPEGRVVLAGVSGGKEINLVTDVIVNNELTVVGGHGQSWDVEDAVELINSQKYQVEKMISHVFPMVDVEKAMEMFLKPPTDCIRIGLIP